MAGQTTTSSTLSQAPTQEGNLAMQATPQSSRQVSPTIPTHASSTFVPTMPQAPIQSQQVNVAQQPSVQVTSEPNVPPSFVPNQSQAPVQANKVNAPQPPIQQTSEQITSTPNVPPVTQGSGQMTSAPNVLSAFAPNEPQPSTPQASGQLNPAPPTPTTQQVQPNPQVPSTSPQVTRRQVVEPPVNLPRVSSTSSSNAQSQSPSMVTKQSEGFSQRDGAIPPAPMKTNSGDIQPTEREKPAEQKPESAQNGDWAE